jgi:NTP pyrophosphatase (non-canonical NTP hydrolase)
MSDLDEIMQSILKFRNDRDWEKFHNAKDLAICLNIESAELLEAFLWKSESEVRVEKMKEELADVFYSAFLLANRFNLDIKEIIFDKLKKNSEKYPIEKAKGSNKKYSEI